MTVNNPNPDEPNYSAPCPPDPPPAPCPPDPPPAPCPPDPPPAPCPPPGPKQPPKVDDYTPPTFDESGPFEPPNDCPCPTDPGEGASPTHCLEELIKQQSVYELKGAAATESRKLLEDQMAKAIAAGRGYTQAKYDELLARWKEQDADIAKLADMLACSVKCWRCVLASHVGPLIHEVAVAEKKLCGDGKIPRDVHNLYDVQYWHQRNVKRLTRRLERVQDVLRAWTTNPAGAIEKALADNKSLHEKIKQTLPKEPGKVLYDAFLKLIPRHLAIGPSEDTASTKIPTCYSDFSLGNVGGRDQSPGPNVGERSVRDRLIEPPNLPYLVTPAEYMGIICRLVENDYAPAQAALSDARGKQASTDADIAAQEAKLKDWVKAVGEAAGGVIPAAIDCAAYQRPNNAPEPKPQPPTAY